jgi:hypothetical protein
MATLSEAASSTSLLLVCAATHGDDREVLMKLHTFWRQSIALAICAAAVLAASGCSVSFSSGGKTLKKDDVTKDVQNFMSAQLPDLPLTKSIDCPGDVNAKVGTTFVCTATLINGQVVTIPLRVKTTSGDHGSMGSNPDIVDQALAVDLIYHAAPSPGVKSADCPTGITAKVGKKFDCKATLKDGTTSTVTLNVDQAASNGQQHLSVVSAKQT